MAKALGSTAEEELKPGLHVVASVHCSPILRPFRDSQLLQKLKGQVGLLFTDSTPQETVDWVDSFEKPDFSRAGSRATREVILPSGPIYMYNDPSSTFPASMDPQLRKLGLTTTLVKGVPSLGTPHLVCRKGDKLTAEQVSDDLQIRSLPDLSCQAQLLKLIGVQMSLFKVRLVGRWSEDEQWVEVAGFAVEDDEAASEESDGLIED